MNSTLKALLSPRFMLVNREAAKTKCDSDVKAGDITIMSPTFDAANSKKVHMRVVNEGLGLTAKFYTDSDMSFCYGKQFKMNSTLKALLSPRFMFVNRESARTKSDSDVKAGDITIMSPTFDAVNSKKVHMRVVNEGLGLTAKFYTDSDMSFCYGALSVNKCSISLSASDLTNVVYH